MTASKNAYELIKQFEGCKLTAYQDQRLIWTIGYGYTGGSVVKGLTITQEQADKWLAERIDAIASILTQLFGSKLNQNQFDALISLCYNIGQGAFRGSTLVKLINQRDFKGAAQEFLKWNHINGVVNKGLTSRRSAEKDLFQTLPTP